MLVTLGTLRHQLAVEYDLPDNVRHFVRRLARQQGIAWLDPRRTVDRLYAASGADAARARVRRVPRGPGAGHPRGRGVVVRVPPRIQSVRRGLVPLGVGVLVVGVVLYVVLAYPRRDPPVAPAGHGLPVGPLRAARRLLVSSSSTLIANVRGLGDGTSTRSHRSVVGIDVGGIDVTDMDTAAGEALRRRRAGGREGMSARRCRSSGRGPSRASDIADRGRLGRRARGDPRGVAADPVRDRDGLPRPGGARGPGAAGADVTRGSQRVRFDPEMVTELDRDGAVVVHLHARTPPDDLAARWRLDRLRDGRQPAERRRPGPRAADRQPRRITRTCSGSASRSTPSISCPGTRSSRSTSTTGVRHLHAPRTTR